MIRQARCVDCGGRLDFREPATWTHAQPGVGHAPMPERDGRDVTASDLRGLAPGITGGASSEEYVRSIRDDEDWVLPDPFHVAPETESERRAAWGDR